MTKRLISILLLFVCFQAHSGTYQIDGNFDGCEYGKIYPLMNVGILECQEYQYFYEYSPEVRTDGREVITIGNQRVRAVLRDGSVMKTTVSSEFEGCDFDRRISFDNGLIFVCDSYSYTYSYRPNVKIYFVSGRTPEVYIDGEKYSGMLYKR